MDTEEQFYTSITKLILKRFGIEKPTPTQLNEMHELLFNNWLCRTIILDEKLTTQEKKCLYFAARGKTATQIAEILGITAGTVKNYKKAILRKFQCETMSQAVAIGIRYGQLK